MSAGDCLRCGGDGILKNGMDCPLCGGDGKRYADTFAARIRRFRKQYVLCRTRALTRPLGVWHAITHAYHVAFGRGTTDHRGFFLRGGRA